MKANIKMASEAKKASRRLVSLSANIKNHVLLDMAAVLLKEKAFLLKENKKDIAFARKKGLSPAMLERLTLSEKRLKEMSDSLLEIAKLNDPVGEVIKAWMRPNGLWIHKVRSPIGVILIIYESRPNVTSDCIGLCLKSGNAVILRGGSEAFHSNLAIYTLLKRAAVKHGVPDAAINMVASTDRKEVKELLLLNDYIDLVMPRGGESLIREVANSSKIPVIKHYKGICHVYVDEWADLNMAQSIVFNAKCQRPGVCNAMETLLVHKDIAARFLPVIAKKLKDAGVELRGCPATRKILMNIKAATEIDWVTEYLDLILSIRVVANLDEAIEHINNYGSHHSDSIVTDNYQNTIKFLNLVDSACVYVNASTRFTDGNQFGMGAEIGISTDKLHARGPMALEELTTYKYMVFGNGQVRT